MSNQEGVSKFQYMSYLYKDDCQELIDEEISRLEFKLEMQYEQTFILNIGIKGGFSRDIIFKTELGMDGKCTYFKKWECND